MKYDAAVADCQAKDADMLAINSKAENDWLVSVFKDIRWKGQYYWRSYWTGKT